MGMTSAQRSFYEARLAAAHRHLVVAGQMASDNGLEGELDRLRDLETQVFVLLADSASGKRLRRLRSQRRFDEAL